MAEPNKPNWPPNEHNRKRNEQLIEWFTLSLSDDLPDSVKQAFTNRIDPETFKNYRVLTVTGDLPTDFASFVRYGDNWIIIRPYLDNREYFWAKQITPLFDLQVTTKTTLADWYEQFHTITCYFAQSERGVQLAFSYLQQLAQQNAYPPGTFWRQTCEEIRKVLALDIGTPSNKERVVKNKIDPQKSSRRIVVKSPYLIPIFPLESIELTPAVEQYTELGCDYDNPDERARARDYVLARYAIKELITAHDRELVADLGKRLDPRLRIPAYHARYEQLLRENNGFILLAVPYPTSAGPLAPVGYAAVAGSRPMPGKGKSKRLLNDTGSILLSLSVNPDHRRQGIGTKLFWEALSRVRRTLSATVFTDGVARSDSGYEFLINMCQRLNTMHNSYATKTFMAPVDGQETFTLETTKI